MGVAPLMCAKADYNVPFDPGIETGVSNNYHVSSLLTIPDDAIGLQIVDCVATPSIGRFQFSSNTTGITWGTVQYINAFPATFDVTGLTGEQRYFRIGAGTNPANNPTTVSDIHCAWVYPGEPPDTSNTMTEDKQITQYIYNFTQDISFPAHDFFHFYFEGDLADIADKVYAIEIRGNTVGGNQLSWRLSYAYNGYINTTGAWIDPDSGWFSGKLPIDRTHPFDYWSIGLRLLNDDCTEYTPLLPSEIEYVAITLHYKETVYLQIPPGEYQTIPTTEMPTLHTFTVPALSDTSGYLTMPMDLTTRIFNWVNSLDGFPLLLSVMMFVTIVFICIW